jgi:hypothetical protein
MPSLPETFPNVPSNPALQLEHGAACFGQSEVSPPALHIALPFVSQLVAASILVHSPHFPYLRFESFDTLRRYSDPPLAIQSKAEQLTFLLDFGHFHLKMFLIFCRSVVSSI